MIEITIFGRGGDCALEAARILASAFFQSGKWVQAFPSFEIARGFAPFSASVRADDSEILLRCLVTAPDHIIILDSTLLREIDFSDKVANGGWMVINADQKTRIPVQTGNLRLAVVDASAVAHRHNMGGQASSAINSAMLGAFARITGLISLDSLYESIKFSKLENLEHYMMIAGEAYDLALK